MSENKVPSVHGALTLLRPVLAAVILASAPAAMAQTQGQPPRQAAGQEEITLNLKDADISALISTVAEVTGRNFIIDPRVKAKVTVISKRPMNPKELYRVFLSILQVHGFSAVETGEVIKIIPDINAKQLGPEPGDNAPEPLPSDQIVTRVIPVENIPVAQLIPILRPLVPQQGHLAAYPPTNVLIVSDRAANVDRLRDIINRIDRASDDEIEVVRLEHASAGELVRIVQNLQQAQPPEGPPGSQVRLAADERTNSILISGDRATRVRIRALLAHLDTPLGGGGNTEVVYLKYAKAEELEPVLTGLGERLTETEGGAQGQAQGQPAGATPGQNAEVSIQAHEATNALVINAPPKIMDSLKRVIQQLDVRRAQVLIEAAIAEIQVNKDRELGVQWAASEDGDGVAQTNFTNDSSGGIAQLFSQVLANEPVGTTAGGLSLLAGDLTGNFQWASLIRALSASTDSNILSTPSLLTLDNQEAEIRVAQNIPIITGSFTNQGNNANNPFQTIEREDVGLILKVKPQINEGNSVLLDIEQEASSVLSSTQSGIITDKRSIKTSVLVEDGNLVVLGGLMDEDVREREQRVPGLGAVPLVGELFKYRTANKGKRNLMVFLRPQIMRSEGALDYHTSRKYNYMRARQLEKRERGIRLMPDEQVPVLPEQEDAALPAPFGSND